MSAEPFDGLVEKPENGLRGLRHWRFDLVAGLQVALVSLPLSLGIAIASGAPPVTGLVSAVVAGLVYPLLGGSYVTISGPAAGLAPALLSGMLTLGNGDPSVGYPLLLVAIFLTGVVQLLLTFLNVGETARSMPVAVMEGMLAAIGMMIIIKQIPVLLGDVSAPSISIVQAVRNLPNSLRAIDLEIFSIGAISLVMMSFLNNQRRRWVNVIPAPLIVVGFGIVLGHLFQVETKYLIDMPDNLLKDGLTLPRFAAVWENPGVWSQIILVVVTLTLIDGIESLATVAAVDKIDPFQRRSDPNKTLRAMAVSNILSSLAGGLTIIPGGIKSRANIDAGGRTLWSNAYNALFLMVFLWIGKDLIDRIPLATMASVLVSIGWRLCEPRGWLKVLDSGKEQFFLFVVTVISILATDLLVGILFGIGTKALLLVYLQLPSFRHVLTGRLSLRQFLQSTWEIVGGLFANPVMRQEILRQDGKDVRVFHLSSCVCFNLLALEKAIHQVPRDADVNLVLSPAARVVDHTTMEFLHHFQEQCVHEGRKVQILGLEVFHRFSLHPLSAAIHDGRLHKERRKVSLRQESMLKLARYHHLHYSPAIISSMNEHRFNYLARGSGKEERNIITGTYCHLSIKIFDYSYTDIPQYFVETRHTLLVVSVDRAMAQIPNCVLEPDQYVTNPLVEYPDVHLANGLPGRYQLRGDDEDGLRRFFTSPLLSILETHPHFYLEVRDNHLLAFRLDRDWEEVESIPVLLSLVECLGRTCRPGGESDA